MEAEAHGYGLEHELEDEKCGENLACEFYPLIPAGVVTAVLVVVERKREAVEEDNKHHKALEPLPFH